MILRISPDEFRPLPTLEALIAAHGARKVLAAAAVALWRGRMRKARPPDAAGLSAHLCADIGLPPPPRAGADPAALRGLPRQPW